MNTLNDVQQCKYIVCNNAFTNLNDLLIWTLEDIAYSLENLLYEFDYMPYPCHHDQFIWLINNIKKVAAWKELIKQEPTLRTLVSYFVFMNFEYKIIEK